MDALVKPAPREIRQARADNPRLRERDLAAQLGISEAEFVATFVGEGVTRIEPRVNDVLTGLEAVGEVMALTRNESAVHEKIGVYDKVVTGNHNAMVLGEQIDLRIFPKIWTHGFAVEKRDGDEIRHSLQFFDEMGEAVHKVHLRPASNLYAYQKLVADLVSADQSQAARMAPVDTANDDNAPEGAANVRRSARPLEPADRRPPVLRHAEGAEAQPSRSHSHGRTRTTPGRSTATRSPRCSITPCRARSLSCASSATAAASRSIPGRSRTSSRWGRGSTSSTRRSTCICRLDHIQELWAVRKPTRDGHVTSLEAYDADRKMIIQFFGKRHEGQGERDDWRFLAENLPRVPRSTAA